MKLDCPRGRGGPSRHWPSSIFLSVMEGKVKRTIRRISSDSGHKRGGERRVAKNCMLVCNEEDRFAAQVLVDRIKTR